MAMLSGVRIVEFEGLGPGPFCGMLLADLGADVILVERKGGMDAGPGAVFKRGKRSIALDLKNEAARDIALRLLDKADALIEGMRPGVMERLGLGPDVVQARNGKIVYGRLTGWGRPALWLMRRGMISNYVGLSGAAWYSGAAGEAPAPPPTLVGDVGGGALYLAIGILSGLLRARESGEGAVVDAAIVDGSAHMMNLLYSLRAAGGLPDARGESMLDGAHFYGVYQCADDLWISVGPLEPKFYVELLQRLEIADDPGFAAQFDRENWPSLKERLAEVFRKEPRAYWTERLYGTDVCFAPVLTPAEAMEDPHMKARNVIRDIGGVMQAAAAPRFDGATPADPGPVPSSGQHTEEILADIGASAADMGGWRDAGAV